MPRIPVYTVDTAPEDSRDPLKALEAKFDKVLNIHGEMAHSPRGAPVLHRPPERDHQLRNLRTRTREAIALPVGKSTTAATASPRTPWQARRPD